MAEEIELKAKVREVFGKQNKKLREQGNIPAIVYGQGKDGVPLSIPRVDFIKAYSKAGENTLVDLEIDGKGKKKVLIHDVSNHFMRNEPVHVDFYEVDLTKKISAAIPIHFLGTAPAVKESGGTLVKNITEVEVEALPTDLPQFFEIDIGPLETFEDLIRVKELPKPKKVEILTNPEEVIAKVQAPRSEEELEALEEVVPSEEEAEVIEELAGEEGEELEGEDEEAAEEGAEDAAEGETEDQPAEEEQETK